ncbi:MAG: hypothetical protein KAX45_09705 [Chitinophagaceae bacterium]|nr:hypothetical protein [Chitinophagaceae bacterium]MBP8244802.1 hypothetical protein [Chitinophagaceae bacterium]
MSFFLNYIDPGSGSYLVQAIIAAVLGAGFWIKASWHRIRAFFGGQKSAAEQKTEEKE